jgi:RimJ/RimL family protein N-acetyltransferase
MNIEIRSAAKEDAEYLFKLANDPGTRKNSFNPKPIEWFEHKSWFSEKLQNPNSNIYIFLLEKQPIGTVRIDKREDETIISVTLDPNYRGLGLGSKIISLGCNEFWKDNENAILAYIKKENVGSIKSFEKAGFIYYSTSIVEGVESLILKAKKHEFRSS